MPRIKIPIVAPPYPTLDGIELDKNSVSVIDGYIDEAGYLIKRPGLKAAFTLPQNAPVDGMAYWQGMDLLVAVCNQRAYTISASGTITDISTPTGSFLQFRSKPTFAFTVINTVQYMAVCNGGDIHVSQDGGSLAAITDPQAPTSATHITFLNNRLYSNIVGSDVFRWSNFEDPFTWDVLGFATAQGEPDQITALYEAFNEILLFGSNTVEFWYSTGETSSPIRRMQGTQLNQGTLSPDGIVFDDEDAVFYFIDSERNINVLHNRSASNISAPIEALIQKLDVTTDARLDLVKFDSHKFILCTFPTDGITFVYDVLTKYWCQWGKYSSISASYNAFLGRSVAWSNQRGLNFVGSSQTDGQIFTLDRDTYLDGGDNIRVATTTGWVDVGTLQSKRWIDLMCRVKRQPNEDYTWQLVIRKDAVGASEVERVIDMDKSATRHLVQRIQNFGTARAIQFEIYHTEDSPFIIGSFELEYTQNRR